MGEPRVSSAMVYNHRRELTRRVGATVVEHALARMSADDRELVVTATTVGWVRASAFERFYDAVAKELGCDRRKLHYDVASFTVEQTLTTLWRVMLRATGDAALLSRTPMFHAKTYDTGNLRARVTAPGEAEIELTAWPEVPELCLQGIRVGVETVLRIAGRQQVRVTSEPVPGGARLYATWHV